MVAYNNEFQVIDTPEKAYVLGFIYSDGCVFSNGRYYLTAISQKEDAVDLMRSIQNTFPFFKQKIDSSKPTTILLECYKKALFEDLYDNGVVLQKSVQNRFELRFPRLPKELESHFIRGYFDGDGSVYRQKLGNTKFEIGGTCYYMITDLIKILYDNEIDVNLRCRHAGTGLRTIDYYILYSSSDKISKKFAEYIYRDCGEFYLKRKYDKLMYIPDYHRVPLVCPNCGGTNTRKNGQRVTQGHLMQRGMCKDCNKMFSVTAPADSNVNSGEDELLEG